MIYYVFKISVPKRAFLQIWSWRARLIRPCDISVRMIAKIQLSRHRNRARHIHPTGIYNDGRDDRRMPEIPLKISRAIICKKARELPHNNFMGLGKSVLCNFAERTPMTKAKGIENPEKEELRCPGQGSRNREGSSRTSLDSTAIDTLLLGCT